MKTLIELYDSRPIENVLSTEVFCPERTIYLYPRYLKNAKKAKQQLQRYFKSRGVDTHLQFIEIDIYDVKQMLPELQKAVQAYPDCALDITGGSDAALFAAGLFCAKHDIPVFTYSRKRNCFFNIQGCSFGDQFPCTLQHAVDDCFLMAGGNVRMGRVDNSRLSHYLPVVDNFFRIYLKHKSTWKQTVHYIQQASQLPKDAKITLHVDAPTTVKSMHGGRLQMPREVMLDLSELGFLKNLNLNRNGFVSFDFQDEQVRTWLRDIGSVLELYVYKACLDLDLFNDVKTSVVVEWDDDEQARNRVKNELDVVAMRGIVPLFISCKTGSIETEALNELAVLRDRFGGDGARAAVVSAQRCQSVTRHRATELGITVIDIEDLRKGRLASVLSAVVSVPKTFPQSK